MVVRACTLNCNISLAFIIRQFSTEYRLRSLRVQYQITTDLFLLDQPCLDSDLIEISQLINDWREIAPFLGLTETDEQNILEYAPNSVPGQRITMLRTWRQRHGPAATYGRLADSFRQYGRQDLVERLSVLVNRKETSSSTGEPLLDALLAVCIVYVVVIPCPPST